MIESLLFKSEKTLERNTREDANEKMASTGETEQGPSSTASSTSGLSPTTSFVSESSISPITHSSNTITVFTGTATTDANMTTAAVPYKGGAGPAGTAVAIIITVAVIVSFLAMIYFFLKRKGKLTKFPCYKPISRLRKSSTSSSRKVLEEHEVMENHSRPKPDGQADDAFTIDDFDGTADPQEGREEYYYDEVFGQSQFEDETTNNAMRQLYSDSQDPPEEEMLDLDFETLGIKIENYTPEMTRKNTA